MRVFIGFTKFYKPLIERYRKIIIPLTNLTKKDQEFKWENEQKEVFKRIKVIVASEPIVIILDLNRLFKVEIDILKHIIGAILGQRDGKGRFRLYAFLLYKFSDTE